jgi:uncharacterized protein YjbJ (UPF0337 family)
MTVDTDMKMRMEGRWDQVRGRIKEAWGDLTDDELDQTEGKYEQVVGVIKQKTGESMEAVEDRLKRILED